MSNNEHYAECLKHAQWVDRQLTLFLNNQLEKADFKVDTPFEIKKTRAKLAALKLDAEQQLEHARKCLWVQPNQA